VVPPIGACIDVSCRQLLHARVDARVTNEAGEILLVILFEAVVHLERAARRQHVPIAHQQAECRRRTLLDVCRAMNRRAKYSGAAEAYILAALLTVRA